MREEKKLLKEEIKSQITDSGSFLFMRYLGLSANSANEFRSEVEKIGGNVEMVPKRVLIKAAEDIGITLDKKELEGHIGLIFSPEDLVGTAKYAFKFSKDNGKIIEIIGGRIDGQMYGAEEVEKLSKLPSMDEMRSQLLATFEAPMAQTLSVMDALLTSVMHCLENKSKKEEN